MGTDPIAPQFDPIKTSEVLLPTVDENNPNMSPVFKVQPGPGRVPDMNLEGSIEQYESQS